MQKPKEKRHRLIVLLMLITYFVLPAQSYAAGPIDITKDVSLSVIYSDGGKAIQGAEFRLYKVADVDAYGKYTPTAAFSSYPVSLEGINQQGWRTLALTLHGYVLRDKIPETDRGMTGSLGVVNFPAVSKSLKPGLYLITAGRVSLDGYIYTAAPFMLAMPGLNKNTNAWSYSLTVSPKYEREKEPGGGTYPYVNMISQRVIKVWEDESESERPSGIRADILRNGEIFDTVYLNKDNNWRHTWEKLDAGYEWTVVEKEVEGYTVRMEKSGNVWIISNKKKQEDPPPAPVDPSPKPPRDKPPVKLPQTGMLWWRVQLLAISGTVLLITGILRKRRGRDGE